MTATTETKEPPAAAPAADANAVAPAANAPPSSCPTCAPTPAGARTNSYVYALGRIEPRYPRISVEKEFMQALASVDTAGLTDRRAFHKVLSLPHNRYLVRQLCWIMTISGLETYILLPCQPTDWDLLVESLRPAPDAKALDAVIGAKGTVAPAEMCNGLLLPIVTFDQLYSFDRESLIKALPIPKRAQPKDFAATAAEVLDRILSVTDNAGAMDGHRALNYLAVRYHGIYSLVAECHERDFALTAAETRPWRLSAARKIVEVLFTFTQRRNEFVEQYFVRVDVNDEFPFLVSKIAPYCEH